MASTLFLMLKRLFSDLDMLHWVLFNKLFFFAVHRSSVCILFSFSSLKGSFEDKSIFLLLFEMSILILFNFSSQPSLHLKSTGQMSRARERE